jgi:riboflavin synthase
MFTGLVQHIGRLTYHQQQVQIQCPGWVSQLEVGDSVAVEGLCLTVTQILEDGFTADLSPETQQRSFLGRKKAVHYPVNLELSLRAGDKLGGHFVTGHIDGVGELVGKVATERAWELSFRVPGSIGRYVVSKGSIAINGVSLTVADLAESGCWFKVAVIPHTYYSTTLSSLAIGDPVNVEGDILGKYVEKLLGLSNSSPHDEDNSPVSLAFLSEHGYT